MPPGDGKASRPRVLPPRGAIIDFIRSEVSGGVVLLVASAAAIIWANASSTYFSVFETGISVSLGELSTSGDLRHWINDGLMTVFFFVVALEIKRELVTGELRDRRAAALPVLGAVGGAMLPAIIFLAILGGGGDEARGWAIPMATDIAFAIGILALLGNRVSTGVKVLLLSIAIVDDVIAIIVIAVFYASDLELAWLVLSLGAIATMLGLRKVGVGAIWPYVPIGIVAWFGMHESGVHATMAGVAIGLLTPAHPFNGRDVLDVVEHRLHPVSSLAIVPLFALANAGIVFEGETISEAVSTAMPYGIAVGLFVGKMLGIAGTILLVEKIGLGTLPSGVRRAQVWGVASLGGVGFTVSLFIAQLSYSDAVTLDVAKMGIFTGSFFSAVTGMAILARSARTHRKATGGGPPAAEATASG